jgi:hypothetical protein
VLSQAHNSVNVNRSEVVSADIRVIDCDCRLTLANAVSAKSLKPDSEQPAQMSRCIDVR